MRVTLSTVPPTLILLSRYISMENLNFVNLIQAAMFAVGMLGAMLIWQSKPKEYRGIAILFCCIAISAVINITEETGITRQLYLISPVFVMLFGPLTYLSIKLLINKQLSVKQYGHLLPILPVIFFTSHPQTVIAIGSIWRVLYALLTVLMLLQYKRVMDQQRSDADDFSLQWLVWLLVITAAFNVIDIARLNVQPWLPYQLNLFGQGINNLVWLIASTIIIVKLQLSDKIPISESVQKTAEQGAVVTDSVYHAIFQQLDQMITAKQWFLKPRLTLNDVSQLSGLQIREISRAINLVTEKSFNEYINHYRVEFVCRLLSTEPNRSLSAIAADAGFSSKASFNKVFKQLVGVTPSAYKAANTVQNQDNSHLKSRL